MIRSKTYMKDVSNFRSSHWSCYLRKGVLRNFAKFTGKHLCQSLFFNKVAGVRLLGNCFCNLSTMPTALHMKNTFYKKIGTVFIHHKNIQELAVEILKVKNDLTPETVKDIFMELNENYYNFETRVIKDYL